MIKMKVAITSTGNTLDSLLNQHFGRCEYFVVYDTDTKGLEIFPNPYKNMEEGAGYSAVQLLAEKGVHKVISGEFGLKVKPILDSRKIQMIILKNPNKRISGILELLNHY
jgi:predicted Fe-Mo cluster-binding NifX family protein